MQMALRKCAVPVLALAVLAVSVAAGAQAAPAHAQVRPGPAPGCVQWCGLTDTGGSVVVDLSSDKRFVVSATIRLPSFTIDTHEMGVARPAQIVDSSFILRADNVTRVCKRTPGSGRCTKAPCHPRCTRPPCDRECEDVVTNELMIRGQFTAPDRLSGSFSAIGPTDSSTRRIPVEPRRTTGTYVAWPVGSAPCP